MNIANDIDPLPVPDPALTTPEIPTIPDSKQDHGATDLDMDRCQESIDNTLHDLDAEFIQELPSTGPCSCTQIFTSTTSKNCSLCDQPISALENARNQSIEIMETLDVTKRELEEAKQRADLQEQHLARLNARVQELEHNLESKSSELVRLKKDMQALNAKYVGEINRVSDIQHEKDLLEQELEELSRRLFEEANGMVAVEKREKWKLEVAYRQLEGQLKETEDRLFAEQSQLQELRIRMEEMTHDRQQDEEGMLKVSAIYGDEKGGSRPSMEEKIKRISANDPYFRAQLDMAKLHGIAKETSTAYSSSLSLPPSPSSQPSPPPNQEPQIDDHNWLEFQEFVQVATVTPPKKLHSIPFLKHCLNEDIEPCLRFGPHPLLSSRKIADAIMISPCFIEESSEGYEVPSAPTRNSGSKQSWFSSSTNNAVQGCHACGRPGKIVHFRFKLIEQDDWSYIDESCRERLVAVCEFYVFIRNTRLGYYATRSIDDLYSEATRLRLQMFYSR
jgi:GDP/GTP exchange factor Sec2p